MRYINPRLTLTLTLQDHKGGMRRHGLPAQSKCPCQHFLFKIIFQQVLFFISVTQWRQKWLLPVTAVYSKLVIFLSSLLTALLKALEKPKCIL